jgi:hypothetical protein
VIGADAFDGIDQQSFISEVQPGEFCLEAGHLVDPREQLVPDGGEALSSRGDRCVEPIDLTGHIDVAVPGPVQLELFEEFDDAAPRRHP